MEQMHFGRILWYNQDKRLGVIEVEEHDISTRYFLLYSKILSAPVQIRTGQFVRFVSSQPANRPDLLPTAFGINIAEVPFERTLVAVLSGANAEAQKGGEGGAL